MSSILAVLVTMIWFSIALAVSPVCAAERDPLLEVLIRKGILTPEEARQIQKEARELEKEREKKVEKVEQKVEKVEEKVAESEKKASKEVAEKVAEVETKIEKKASGWLAESLPEPLKGLKVGVLAYVDYSVGDSPRFMGPRTATGPGQFGRNNDGHVGLNRFLLTRGYLNVEKEITPWLAVRYTPDLTQDDTGDWKIRQKYLYAELRPPNLRHYLTGMKGEIGLGHVPWQDFEETVYPYRCQGTVPLERSGVMRSADLGVSLKGNFGLPLANAKEVLGNDAFDGRYGSWQVGVYNGSGFTQPENNPNKPVEYRATLRPLPDYLPGFQATYFGLYGKGNSSSASNFGAPFFQFFPDWIVHMGYLSYQHPWFLLSAQNYYAKGNQAGNWTTQPTGPAPIGRRADSIWTRGYSLFGDVRLPVHVWGEGPYPLHAFIRTDWFDADVDHVIARSAKYTKLITGLAYYLYKKNMILLAYERTWYGQDYAIQGGTGPNGSFSRVVSIPTNGSNLGTDQRFQMVFQISYP